jgi:hypothetical protein
MLDVGNPLVNRHAATESEEDQGNDQTPEVELLAPSKGVQFIGWLLAFLNTKHEQQLVASVSGGVDSLRDHGGTASDPGDDEFAHSYEEVGEDGPLDVGVTASV